MDWTTLTEGLSFPEGPRWHAGRLWLSDTGAEGAFACRLGGPERRTLFVCLNQGSGPGMAGKRAGRVVYRTVGVPGAGWPGNEG